MPAASLYDSHGSRKYLTAHERRAVAIAALRSSPPILTFSLTLLYTGARISEALELPPGRIDRAEDAIVLETLKRRKRGVYRAVPVPSELIERLMMFVESPQRKSIPGSDESRVWAWGRTTAWKYVKAVMESAGIPPRLRTPRALRHAFGVNAIQTGVALNVLQKWMGHARIETTAIYADAIGDEERALAKRTWTGLQDLEP